MILVSVPFCLVTPGQYSLDEHLILMLGIINKQLYSELVKLE